VTLQDSTLNDCAVGLYVCSVRNKELGTFHDGVVSSSMSAKICLQSIPSCAFDKHSVFKSVSAPVFR
jgi:hypothetical protein